MATSTVCDDDDDDDIAVDLFVCWYWECADCNDFVGNDCDGVRDGDGDGDGDGVGDDSDSVDPHDGDFHVAATVPESRGVVTIT